jgi:hypothetical protein
MEKFTANHADPAATQPYQAQAERRAEELMLPEAFIEDSWEASTDHLARMLYWADDSLSTASPGEQTVITMPFIDAGGNDRLVVVWGTKTPGRVESSVTVHSPEDFEEIIELSKSLED